MKNLLKLFNVLLLTGILLFQSNIFAQRVKLNNRYTFTVNSAVSGCHIMDFITPSGAVSGKVNVRISNTDL